MSHIPNLAGDVTNALASSTVIGLTNINSNLKFNQASNAQIDSLGHNLLIGTNGTISLTFGVSITATALASVGVVHTNGSGLFSTSSIINVDVNASAAIAGTKISPDFGSQNVVSTGSGTFNGIIDSAFSTVGIVHNNVVGAFTTSLIVNADVSASAAIDGSKITPNFGSSALTAGNITSNSSKVMLLPTKIVLHGVAGSQSTANSIFTSVGAIVFDPSAYVDTNAQITRALKFVTVLEVSTAGLTISVELYNTDTATYVTNSLLTSTSTTPERKTSSTLVVTTDFPNSIQTYEVHIKRTGGLSTDLVTCKLARLEIIYT